jgi:hypothetical protein
MRKSVLVLVLVVGGSWSASQARAGSVCGAVAGNLVTNCGFETGDFTGWTIDGNTLNPGDNYYGVDGIDANSGNFGAYMSQDFVDAGMVPVGLSQMLATSVGSVYDITFWLEQDTAPTLGYTHAFTASWGGTAIQSLTPTVGSPGSVGSFTQYSFVETATGTSTALQFSFENDDQYWSFDDVSVVGTATTPEPSTGVVGGISLGALLLLWSRRRGPVDSQADRA